MSHVNFPKIAKNTLLLYVRMFLIMAVSLYTSRVILDTLGVSDYGIYMLVTGFISIFTFVSQTLVSSLQRFLNVAMGKGEDGDSLCKVYIMGINIFIIFSLILLLIGETVGLWLITHYLNIPVGREDAVFWVYQLSLVTMIIQLFRISDSALIISHEKMSFYAYVSIFEAVLKLLAVFILKGSGFDKLIFYAWLYLAASVLINIIYRIYCRITFSSCRYRFFWDKSLFRNMFSFSGWMIMSDGARTVSIQVENIFLNNFYSVTANAARGIASQVYNSINLFLVNFQTAFTPQLMKSYAAGEDSKHAQLLYKSSKFSYYLFLLLLIPVVSNLESLLSIWLVDVPTYTREFCVYVLFAYLADAMAHPLYTSLRANGNIRGAQLIISFGFIIQLIASYFLMRAGYPPYFVSVLIMISHIIHYFVYLFFCQKYAGLMIKDYLKLVILPIVTTTIVAFILPIFLKSESGNFLNTLILFVVDACWVLFSIYIFGLSKTEKGYLSNAIATKFSIKRK